MNHIKIGMAFGLAFTCLSASLKAQNAGEVVVKSIVSDDKGLPVAGAMVSGKGGSTLTDLNGQFTITVPAHSVLRIMASGFGTQSLSVDAVPAKIQLLKENALQTVAVAFKKIDRQDLPGAISVLDPQTSMDRDYNLTVEGGMNGRVAGLLGSNNIWGLENALVMIDGVRRQFSDISMSEVQQVTVLKGVNAVALYGSQAAKGAILITTKRGEANGRKVNVRVNSGIALPKALPKYLGSADYMTLYNEARRNDGLPDLYDAATIQNYRTGNPYQFPSVDYYSSKYLKNYLHATDANMEFSGGNNVARFYSNIGWSNSSTLLKVGEGKDEGDNRFNIRGNVDLKINDFIKGFVDISTVFNQSRRGHGNYWGSAATLLPNRFAPLIPISMVSPNNKAALDLVKGSRNIIDDQYLLGGTQQYLTNPIADLYVGGYDKYIQRVFQVSNGVNVDLSRVLPGLSFHTLFNLDYANSYTQSINNTYSVYAPTWYASPDSAYMKSLAKFGSDIRTGTQNINNTTQQQNIGFRGWLNYEKSVNNAHNISASLLGYSSSVKSNDVYQPATNAHLGLQLDYNFKHRYWANFTGAYVNSTKLPEGNRAALSPTASLGWLLSSEKFLAGVKGVDYLKLSASAGMLNTDLDINGYYLYDNIYTSQAFFTWNDGLQAQNRASVSSYGASPNLSFPKRKEVNASLEGVFFNKLLSLQTTVFATEMDGLPTQRFSQYPNYFSSFIPYTNYNANQRKGIDLMMNLNRKVGAVELNLGLNATYAKSKVTKQDELYIDAYQNRAGKPADAIFGLVSNGFFADQNEINKSPRQVFSEVKPGDIKYVDQNGDNVIDQRDEVMIGRWVAPFNYGVNLNVAYKNFNLYVLGTGSRGGNGVKNNDYYWVAGDKKYSETVWDRWTPDTKETAKFPRLSSSQNNNDFRVSDFWLYKTDRLNLSKVQLSYNFSGRLVNKTALKDLGVYVSGANLITVSKNRDILDLTVAGTPQFRYYTAGVRAKF